MKLADATKILGIEEFTTRIFNSNSHGELIHLWWYFEVAHKFESLPVEERLWFRPLFLYCVDLAEKNWRRPESCFQHMGQLMHDATAHVK